MHNDIDEILISATDIERRVGELGATLAAEYRGRDPLVLAIMSGCVLFLADLLRRMPIMLDLEFVYCRSYEGSRRKDLDFVHRRDLPELVKGRHVIVVDDICDSGVTMTEVVGGVRQMEPASVAAVTLLAKRGAALPGTTTVDHVGFEVENRFVVGYGLDYNGRYRNLPFIGVLRQQRLTSPQTENSREARHVRQHRESASPPDNRPDPSS